MSASDRECIRLCLNGHPDAYRQLVRRYQAPLVSHLAIRLGGTERAEEAAQDALVRAFFALRRLKAADAFFPWLLAIANRVAQDRLRAERRYRRALQSAPPRPDADDPVEGGPLRRAVMELPDTYAQVVLLRYYAGLSCRQVAERLDLPLGTVTKRLSRAHRLLRQSIERYERQPQRSEVRS